jgi:cytochrome c biogenesis protein CcmG/thiol:disulfide interchange protein DsbE
MRWSVAWVAIAVCAALVGLLAYGVASKGSEDSSSIDDALARGERPVAESTALPVLGDAQTKRSLADFRGQVVVLNLWASWCPPCKDELPLLQRTQVQLAEQQATVLGINVKDFTDKALGVVRDYELSFPSLRDNQGEYARDGFGVTRYPETFVIDRKGRVAAHRLGTLDRQWLDATLPELLAEEA